MPQINCLKRKMHEIGEGYYVKFQGIHIYYGIVASISKSTVGVQIDKCDKRNDYPPGLIIYIDRRQILQVYSPKIVSHLTPRLALKHLWKDFIFREVKVTKCNNLLHVDYHYVGKTGFEKVKRFRNLQDAETNISTDYHTNIVPSYGEYFGFTTDKALRNNDNYYDKEIFFSKKCYSELDWSNKPTGDFVTEDRWFNNQPPRSDSLVCGIVENGEKGLFYRKWFVCSPEFLTLWTMVCDPGDSSLYKSEVRNWNSNTWNSWHTNRLDKKKKVKDLDELMKELDTSFYSIDMKLSLEEKRRKFLTHNLERAALYYPNRYKQVAEILFSKGFLKSEEEFPEYQNEFQRKLLKNIMWSKRVVV